MSEYDLPEDFEVMSVEEVQQIEAEFQNAMLTFFDSRRRKDMFVIVDKTDVTKFTFTRRNGEIRYGLRAAFDDGHSANKFVDKASWDLLDVPIGS